MRRIKWINLGRMLVFIAIVLLFFTLGGCGRPLPDDERKEAFADCVNNTYRPATECARAVQMVYGGNPNGEENGP